MNVRTIALTLATCLTALTVCFAQDANTGTWKLNEAKSKLSAGSPKYTTLLYETAGDRVKVTMDGVDANGKVTRIEWTGKFDGRDYRVTGDPNEDTRSYTKIDEHTFGFNVKKAGKVSTSGRIVVSADGKSRTVTMSGTNAEGKKFTSNAVYDKQ
jgi:hypothetical protein